MATGALELGELLLVVEAGVGPLVFGSMSAGLGSWYRVVVGVGARWWLMVLRLSMWRGLASLGR